MKKIIFIAFILFCFIGFSQSSEPKAPCANDQIMKKLLLDFPKIKSKMISFEKNLNNQSELQSNKSLVSLPPSGSITIPVVIYVVHDGTAITNISDAQVNNQLIALNNYFLTTGLKFCLATKAGNITPIPTTNPSDTQNTAGIIHINNPTLSNHTSTSQQALVNTADALITKEKYLKIWIVKSIDGTNSGILGYSMFPNTSPIFDGIVMRYDVFGNGNNNMFPNYNLGKVLVHEVGHYLGLYHTFEGSCSTTNSNCQLDGDRVCDTPTVASPNFNCITDINSCSELPSVFDDVTNYMDYTDNNCQDHFSAGQIERMINVLTLARNTFLNSDNIIYTGTCGSSNLLSANITTNNFSPCTSATVPVSFSALTAKTYSWNFGDSFSTASNPNTSSTQNASHKFISATNSPYTVTLTVTNSTGQSAVSVALIYVTDCTPITNSNSYWYVDSGNGLNFSSGKPIFDPTFPTTNDTNLSCNSQCNENGTLLFYTNNFKVWNKQHTQINTIDLIQSGSTNSSNKLLILPKPPLSGTIISEYYIFTQQGYNSGTSDIGFKYNLVNISGTIATMGVTGQPVTLPSSYGFDSAADGSLQGLGCITAVKKCNGNDFWIITVLKKGNNPYLVVFSLSNTGLSYNSERMIEEGTNGFIFDSSLEIAPNGNKLLLLNPYGGSSPSYIYDFNKAQGLISSNYASISIPQTTVAGSQQLTGFSFSSDSNVLYLSNIFVNKIFQFNVNAINVNATRKEIFVGSFDPWFMQLGPDNKLYIGTTDSSNSYDKLSVIHYPNKIITQQNPNNCGFSLNGPIYPNANSTIRVGPSLPNIIDAQQETAYFNSNDSNVISKYITGCNTYKFFPNVCGSSFIWKFINTTTGAIVTSTATNPTYVFSQNGNYTVSVSDTNNTLLGTLTDILISTINTPIILGSGTACVSQSNANITNNSATLEQGETLTWGIISGNGNITGQNNQSSVNINWINLPGTLKVIKINAAGCTSSATKIITSLCTSLSNTTFNDAVFSINPNPSSGIFVTDGFDFIDKTDVQVIDISGRLVHEILNFNLKKDKSIDITGFQSGIYTVRFKSNNHTFSRKIIKN